MPGAPIYSSVVGMGLATTLFCWTGRRGGPFPWSYLLKYLGNERGYLRKEWSYANGGN